jgi:diaminohydroxyphosphoribosylaminopyrimidine deaminase/5-amino-6-(5-phosphoribosylamino)uracil reductase
MVEERKMEDVLFNVAMRRALELALLGPVYGPNPQVGAVILDSQGQIVAEGWHEGAGSAHAEVAALRDLALKGISSDGLTAVVTLEPCNHTGRTGPCAQALLEAGITRVVYGSSDPGKNSGGGAATLRDAGVEVIGGVMQAEADELNHVWLTAAKQGHPFVTLKWASSLDGRGAANDGSSQWISGSESRADAHKRRSEIDAILVGAATVAKDDPELTARKIDGTLYEHQPLRVVMGESELDLSHKVFNDNAETVQFRTQSIHGVLAELQERGIKHLMVEGGPKVASSFVKLGLVNEFITYLAPMLLGGEKTAFKEIGVTNMDQAQHLEFKEVRRIGDDIYIRAVKKGN